jgi:hypothetical protein
VGVDFAENSIVKVDGMTGLRTTLYTGAENTYVSLLGIHPDGTIFAGLDLGIFSDSPAVVGVDSITGAAKFNVPVSIPPFPENDGVCGNASIVGGDGYFYLAYGWMHNLQNGALANHTRMLRVDTSGGFDDFALRDWTSGFSEVCAVG